MSGQFTFTVEQAAQFGLLGVLQSLQRVFDYGAPFPASEPGCALNFVQSFHHTDWVDGESLVQAGQTQDEEGFNVRLHNIESDLASLAANLKEVFDCMASMRKNLHDRLEDIKNELNRIDTDVFNCCNGSSVPKVPFFPYNPANFPLPGVINPGDPFFSAGPPDFLGPAEFQGQNVLTWRLGQAVMVLPNQADPWQQSGLQKAGLIQQFASSNADFQNAFAVLGRTTAIAVLTAGPTVAQLIDRFGAASLGGGITFKDAVSILPPALQFSSSQALAGAVAEREGAALRASATTAALIASSLGLDPRTGSIAQAPTANLLNATEQVKKALVAGGLDTVGKVASANQRTVIELLQRAGVAGAPAEAGRLNGLANTLTNIG